jgi:hypothetical protein
MTKTWEATVIVEYVFECDGKDFDEAHEDALQTIWDAENMATWKIHLMPLKGREENDDDD